MKYFASKGTKIKHCMRQNSCWLDIWSVWESVLRYGSVFSCNKVFVYIIHWTGGVQRATDPHMQNFACFGRKTKKNPKRKDGKSPPQAPQPHLHPEISSYIRYALTRRLWSQLIGCFHVFSSYTHVRVKKPLKSPVSVGLVQQYIVLSSAIYST